MKMELQHSKTYGMQPKQFQEESLQHSVPSLRKKERTHIHNLNLYLREPEKEE